MKRKYLCLVLALLLLLPQPVLAAQPNQLLVTLEQIINGEASRAVATAHKTEDGYVLTLTPPASCLLPDSITVTVDGRSVPEEQGWSYDALTGNVLFESNALDADVLVKARFLSGTIRVNGKVVYRNGKRNHTLPAGVHYEPETQTLTLDNACIDQAYVSTLGSHYGIYTDLDGLTLQLLGSSVITMPRSVGTSSYGIHTGGSLCIRSAPGQPNGALTILAADAESASDTVRTYGISCGIARTPLTVENVALTITGGAAKSSFGAAGSYGICLASAMEDYGGLRITGSTLDVTAGPVSAGTYGTSVAIAVNGALDQPITVENSTVRASGGPVTSGLSAIAYGMELAGPLHISAGSAVTAQAGQTQSTGGSAAGMGLYSLSPVTVENASLAASAQQTLRVTDTDGGSGGIFAQRLTVQNAHVTLSGADRACFLLDDANVPFAADAKTVHIPAADAPKPGFADVHDVAHWAAEAIDLVTAKGLFTGTAPGYFSPEAPLTRSQMATVLWRLAGMPAPAAAAPFADVPAEAYYAKAVAWAAESAIVTGVDGQTFAPDRPVTRQQLAAMLWRYAKHTGRDVSVGEDTNILSYTDAFDVSEYAIPAIQWACGAGIMSGTNGSLLPHAPATRAQAAQMLANYIAE